MKKGVIVFFVFSLILFFSQTGFCGEKNLIKNGGFEKYKEGDKIPEGWILNLGYPCKITVMEDENLAHGGKIFLRIDEDKEKGKNRSGAIYCKGPNIKKGEKYKFSVWAKGRGKINLFIYEYDAKGFLGSASSEEKELTPEWKEYVFIYIPGETKYSNPEVARISPAIHIRGTAYVDDVSLIKLEEK